MSPQTQTADGTGRPQTSSTLRDAYTVFAAGADVYKQRTDAYADQYAEVQIKSSQRAICLPAGGELHTSDGQVIPVAPYDWVVEMPDGTMGSLTAEMVADHMEVVGGNDEMRDAFDATVQRVENGRKAPGENVTLIDDSEPMPHADHARAIDQQREELAQRDVMADLQRQAESAHQQLELLAGVAQKRNLIDSAEAAEWVDTGIAPEGVSVRFDQGLQSYEVLRAPTEGAPSDGGAVAVVEPEPSEK